MTELLSHVLLAYIIFTVVSWRVEWLTQRWVAVGMIGSLLPDLNRIGLFVTDTAIEATLEVPFGIGAIHTLGGVVLFAAVGSLVIADHLKTTFGLLLAGGLSHLIVDSLKVWVDGAASAWLYPVSWYRPPTPGLYVSSDTRVLAVVGIAAVGVAFINRGVVGNTHED